VFNYYTFTGKFCLVAPLWR